jgi:hypothetical protein
VLLNLGSNFISTARQYVLLILFCFFTGDKTTLPGHSSLKIEESTVIVVTVNKAMEEVQRL